MTKPPPDEAVVPDEIVSFSEARLVAEELPQGRWTKDEAASEIYRWLNEEGPVLRAIPPISAIMARNEARVRSGLRAVVKRDPLWTSLERLTNASEAARRQIQIAYAEAIPEGKRQGRDAAGRRRYERDLAGAKRLAEAVDAAWRQVSSTGGDPYLVGFHKGADLLKEKFEAMSRSRFTFAHDKVTGGAVVWLTPGALFVACGLQCFFPNITDANLVTTMRNLRGDKNLQKPSTK